MRDRLEPAFVDRYTIERELGRGGMATVWLARDLRHQRRVALKVLHPEVASAIGVDRFLLEIRLTARLQHPAIVPLLDSGVVPAGAASVPWYAMPYLEGESLRARLARESPLPIDEALRLTTEVADALQAAHHQGIVHRDIKPENVLLVNGRAYVVDFGIAKALIETGGERLTSAGLAVGTPAYMSPEQASGAAVDARTDQYSLATVLYEMLAGEPPFTGPTAQAVVARRFAEPARRLRPVRSTVPDHVESAVLRALERIPADRFDDVAGFAMALGSRADGKPRAPGRIRARTRARVVAAGIVAAAIGGWFLFGRGGELGRPDRDPEVVALYQRGLRGYDRRTPAGITEAMTAFSAAVHRDSGYTESWTGLAQVYVRAYERQFPVGGRGMPWPSVWPRRAISREGSRRGARA